MIITLTTDFGLSDPFVGIMKGVILGIAPEASIVDVSHGVAPYDILGAALVIESAYRYFPKGTVHALVVDPGVGSSRRPLAAVSQGHVFVAPDNGLLSAVAAEEVYHITNAALFLNPVSRTFHGRDIFAPVAAYIAQGMPLTSVGPRVADFLRKPLPKPVQVGDVLLGSVLRIDQFGNVITNLRRSDLGQKFTIRVAGSTVTRLYETFSDAAQGEFFALEGSTGYIELALNQGSAAERLNVQAGAEIEVESGTANQ